MGPSSGDPDIEGEIGDSDAGGLVELSIEIDIYAGSGGGDKDSFDVGSLEEHGTMASCATG